MRTDTAKAAVWAVISGVANVVSIGVPRDSDWYFAFVAVGYGLLLPAIAVMHVRQRAVRDSGAVLATAAGTAGVAVGIASSASGSLVIPAVFVLGVWWWTIGKMWAETSVLPRATGYVTMGLAVVALALSIASYPLKLDIIWIFGREVVGAWTLLLAYGLYRSGR